MTVEFTCKCDTCSKITDKPKNWIEINESFLLNGKKETGSFGEELNSFDGKSLCDPHFCCPECLKKWYEKILPKKRSKK